MRHHTLWYHFWLVVLTGVLMVPVLLALVGSSHTRETMLNPPPPLLPGDAWVDNYNRALLTGHLVQMLLNSLVMALGIAAGKIIISFLSACAIVYFRLPCRALIFWMIFITLMLPVEVRIVPTYVVVADLGLLDTHAGLILPLIASATATFLFRQFFMTIPAEMAEAARLDGVGPVRFLVDILLPVSRVNIAALFVILFIYGWNQYLWPLLVTTEAEMGTIVTALGRMSPTADEVPDWPLVMAAAILAMLPPVLVIVAAQGLFIRGLLESDK